MKKIQVLLRATLVFLLAFFVSFNLVVDKAMATGQFSLTCEDITLDGSTLSAMCETRNGDQKETSINLDKYIGNLDGTLSWDDHNFSQTCSDLGLAQLLSSRQLILAANCERAVGGNTYSPSDIELDAHIANIDGTLKYE
jgi:hypothetical protein